MEKYLDLDYFISLLKAYLPNIVGAILTLVIGFIVIGWIVGAAKRLMRRSDIDATVAPFLASLLSVGLKVLLLLSVAGMFGIETTSFIAIFSALALAIGMALQGSLGHFASGVLLLIFKPYKVGDLVTLSDKTGVVEELQVFNTVLMTPDNKRIIIPNGIVTSNVMVNISGQGEIRVDTTFGIGYDDDIDKARAIIQSVVDRSPLIDKTKPTDIFVSELGGSSVNFTVRPWAKSAHYWDVYFYLQENIKKEFDKAGIGIPFPQMDVHLKGEKPAMA